MAGKLMRENAEAVLEDSGFCKGYFRRIFGTENKEKYGGRK